MNKQNNTLLLTAIILIVYAAFTRLVPHPPNFTAIGAMAVFGGSAISNKKVALLLPVAALFLSDVCLQLLNITPGFYGGQLFVYIAFILITWMATYIRKPGFGNITMAAIWSGVIFFLISNLGVWAFGEHLYPKTFSGLMTCYAAAIPFYKNEFFGNFLLNTIMGNLFFSALLFGSYYIIASQVKKLKAYA